MSRIPGNIQDTEATIGRVIRRWRIEGGFSQNDVAERAGLSRSAVQGLERGTGTRLATLLAVLLFVLIVFAAYVYGNVFSGRGAFIHVGAFVGTIMADKVVIAAGMSSRELGRSIGVNIPLHACEYF